MSEQNPFPFFQTTAHSRGGENCLAPRQGSKVPTIRKWRRCTRALLFFIILIVSAMSLPQAEALGIGPPSFELDLQMGGLNSTAFYITSDGLTGQLIVGLEDLPFRVDPPTVNMSSSDVNTPVELTFYGNETLMPGVYEGKVTFLAYTGGFVAMGIKIRAKINLLEETYEPEPEPETQELNYTPYVMGGTTIAALALIVWWIKR